VTAITFWSFFSTKKGRPIQRPYFFVSGSTLDVQSREA
jgi:hypothetical protein